MPNRFEHRELMNQLIHDKKSELMPHELNDILEKELSKPAEDVDVQLVNDLLDLLGAEEPTAAQKEACWQNIQEKRKPFHWQRALRRIAAAAAAIMVLFFVSFETAKAFRWTFLLKLLAPVAETFGIYSTSTFDSETSANINAIVLDDDTEYEQLTYASIDQMPSELNGYKALPGWVPERFAFAQGSYYQDPDMEHCSIFYAFMEDFLTIEISVFYNDESVFGFEYERTLPQPLTEEINGHTVNYYHNMEGNSLSASWIDGTAHYHVHGNISAGELEQIVGGMME